MNKTILFISLALMSCGKSADKKALFFGDSLTAWGTYPAAVAEGREILNYAVPSTFVGDHLRQNLARLEEAEYVEVCVVMFGFNDAHHPTPVWKYQTELDRLVKGMLSHCEHTFVATQPRALGRPDWTNDALYAAATRLVVAGNPEAHLIDVYAGFNYDPLNDLTADNVHFNAQGNEKLTRFFLGDR